MNTEDRFSRNVAFFGAVGQGDVGRSRVAVVGLGGLGSHIVQQLSYLGVKQFVLVDPDVITMSSLNRVVGGVPGDADLATPKVVVAQRMIEAITGDADVVAVHGTIETTDSSRLNGSTSLISCLDTDASRLTVTEICGRLAVPFFDLATDTGEDEQGLWYGGRVLFSGQGARCPSCMDLLDQRALSRQAMTNDQLDVDNRIYGVKADDLVGTGPSVVALNGVLASLAVMEWMVWTTGLRPPRALIEYRGSTGAVFVNRDSPRADCYYCEIWRSTGAA